MKDQQELIEKAKLAIDRKSNYGTRDKPKKKKPINEIAMEFLRVDPEPFRGHGSPKGFNNW